MKESRYYDDMEPTLRKGSYLVTRCSPPESRYAVVEISIFYHIDSFH